MNTLGQNERIYRNSIASQMGKLEAAVKSLDDNTTIFNPQPTTAPDDTEIDVVIAPNEIDNSDFDFSKDGYTNSTPAGGDIASECFNFFRQRFIRITDAAITSGTSALTSASNLFKASYTYPMDFVLLGGKADGSALSGTLTRVTDGAATLSLNSETDIAGGIMWFGEALAEGASTALKASAHSLFAANEGMFAVIPRWDKTNGWVEIGSNTDDKFDIALPLPINIVRSGLKFHFRVILARRTGSAANTNPLTFALGVWDNTAGQKRFLEAGNFDLTVTKVNPDSLPASTTYKYKVIAVTNEGFQIESDTVTLTNAADVLSARHYNRLTWKNVVGIQKFHIERELAGVVKRIFTITNGTNAYNDFGGDDGPTLPGFTTTGDGSRAIAYTEKQFTLGDEDEWFEVSGEVYIPSSYDMSATTGKQWIRLMIFGTITDVRQVLLDRVMFSLGNGGWNRSIRDRNRIASQNPDSSPTGSNQGDTGINCLAEYVPVEIFSEKWHRVGRLPVKMTEKGQFTDSGGSRLMKPNRIVRNKRGLADTIVRVTYKNGIWFDCTPSERIITSRADKKGTMLEHLFVGDEALAKIDEIYQSTEIESYEILLLNGKIVTENADELFLNALCFDEAANRHLMPVHTLKLTHGKIFTGGFLPEDASTGGALFHNRKNPDILL